MGREEHHLHGCAIVGGQHLVGHPAAAHGREMTKHIHGHRDDAARFGRDQFGPIAPVDQTRGEVKNQVENAWGARALNHGLGDELLDPRTDAGQDARVRKQGIENRRPHPLILAASRTRP
jgi:hypothetical protein